MDCNLSFFRNHEEGNPVMKKLYLLLFVGALSAMATGCGQPSGSTATDDKAAAPAAEAAAPAAEAAAPAAEAAAPAAEAAAPASTEDAAAKPAE